MKRKSLICLLLFILANRCFAQNKATSPIIGWWVNTQYEYFKNQSQSEKILYNISPWFIHVDSSGKCIIVFLYEQKTEIGYPISKNKKDGEWEYHYKRVWLYSIKGNDSLLIYRNGDAPPGAGIVFKRYK